MHDEDPFFFEASILNICTKYDITVELRQPAFNYGRRNLESGNGGRKKENEDGMLVLMIVTVRYPAVVWSILLQQPYKVF